MNSAKQYILSMIILGWLASGFSTSPVQAQCSGEVLNISAPLHTLSGTVGTYTVPAGGLYKMRLTAKGAKGGDCNNPGGQGRIMTGTFILLEGQNLEAIAGAPGQNGAEYYLSGGGGGGSGVRNGNHLLIIAGGGGGSTINRTSMNATNGANGLSGGSGPGFAGDGGINGNGGSGGGIYNGTSQSSGGGGGAFSAGGDGAYGNSKGGGGGYNASGGNGFGSTGNGGGGFGGGGGSYNQSAGGGGGYSGGGGGGMAEGGGGGSINFGSDQNNDNLNNAGGQVIIECLGPAIVSAIFNPAQPVCANPTQGSLSIDLTGDLDGNTNGMEYAIVAGNSFSGTPTFADITSDPFYITSGFGTTGLPGGTTYTIRIRLKYNPALYIGSTYTIYGLSGGTIYVNHAATGANNGTSWADAFTDLQSALSNSCSGSQIWVAAGTYKPTSGTNRNISFVMKNGVAIYGGFSGTETQLSQRDWVNNVTTLSGDLGDNDVINGSGSTLKIPNYADNSYHVINNDFTSGNPLDPSAILDGFTIRGGAATAGTGGGGMYNKNASPTLSNIIFIGNMTMHAGGAMENNASCDLTLNNISFTTNYAWYDAGAVMNYTGVNMTLNNVSFTGNLSQVSTYGGGAMLNYDNNTVSFNHCYFDNNYSTYAGALSFLGSEATLSRCRFVNNGASRDAGAIYAENSTLSVTNCAFSGNNSYLYGGVFSIKNTPLDIVNSTFYNNTARPEPPYNQTGVIAFMGGTHSIRISNSILWGNQSLFNSAPVVTYSLIQNNYPGTGNFNDDPLFVNAAAGDLHLQPCSFAVDAGFNDSIPAGITTDFDGNPRVYNAGTVDLGAYEYQGARQTNVVVYVKHNATGNNDGTSWANAYTDLQSAISNATCLDIQIWVAAGTYKPTTGTDRNLSFTLRNRTAVYGGFNGNETSLSQRNLAGNVTILSGDIGVTGNSSDNSYHVIKNYQNGLNSTAILDGFTITGGTAQAANEGGGAVFNDNSAPSFANCIFTGNSGTNGGAIYNLQVNGMKFTNCIFTGNTATVGSTAIYNIVANLEIRNCSFYSSSSPDGRIMYYTATNLTVVNSIFWGINNPVSGILSTENVTYSTVQGGFAGTGNLSADPLFFDKTNGNLRLAGCSPAINAGSNSAVPSGITTDADGKPRIFNNGTVDMGAYEYQSSTSTGPVVYVNDDASGNNDGTSWTDAYTDLQNALALARTCSIVTEIWVAAGTYKPTTGTTKSISFAMKNGVAIYGGFNGTETQLSERNWKTHVTILSGDIGTPGQMNDNSGWVIFNTGLNNTAVLDGFTITGGSAVIWGTYNYSGGMFNNNSSPTVNNCIFTDNNHNAGAGMYNSFSSPTVTNCSFDGNFSQQGGGMYNHFSSPILINCSFTGNGASSGGGMYNTASSPSIINCSFSGNISGEGAALYNLNASYPNITNCIIWGNSNGIDDYNSLPVVSYSIVQGGYPGTGNLDADPLFVSQPTIGLGATGDLRLQACSPAINAGNNASVPSGIATDLDGNPRFYNSGTVDMGAYEYQAEKPTNPTNGGTIAASQTICTGTTPAAFTSSSLPAGYAGTLEYQWQVSTTDTSSGFSNISGANAETYTETATLSQTTWYKRLAKVTCESAWVESNVIQVTVNPTRLFVTESGAGLMNGSNWVNAFSGSQLQTAINSLCVTEVWVAAGTYKPTTGTDRAISFSMKNGVAIYGGFAGTEAQLSQRNLSVNTSVISGDIGSPGDNSDNTFHLFSNNNLNQTAVLDGFTLRDGKTADDVSNAGRGAGMNNYNASPLIRNCIFINNNARTHGGAISNTYSNALVINCLFYNNNGYIGGAISSEYSSVTVMNCTFSGNTGWGSICSNQSSSLTQVYNSIVWGNGIANNNYGNTVVSQSIVQGGYPGTGNLDLDPLFIDAPTGNLHLQPCSPAINVGGNAAVPTGIITDLDGNPRFYNSGIVDMGAYEYQADKPNGPASGGEIAAAQIICHGATPAALTSSTLPSGYLGTLVYQWQSSTAGADSGFGDIDAATTTAYAPGSLIQTTWYRRLSKISCQTEWPVSGISNVLKISVFDNFSAGAIDSTGETICYNTAASQLTGTAPTGGKTPYTYQWQISNDNISYADISGDTTLNFSPGTLTQTKWYRLQQVSAGGCGEAMTNTVKITVEPTPVNGVLTKIPDVDSVCYGADLSATFTAGSGGNGTDVVQYRTKTAGAWSAWLPYDQNHSILTNTISAAQIIIYRDADYCETPVADTIAWVVTSPSIGGSVTGGTQVCYGANSTLLTLSGQNGVVQRWESSTDNQHWTNIDDSTGTTFTAVNLTQDTWFRALIQSGVCSDVHSQEALITVLSNFHISGYARYENNPKTPLNGIQVVLKKLVSGTWVKVDSVETNYQGFYDFDSLTNATYGLTIKSAHPSGQWQTWGGVNMTDYLLTLKHATTGPQLPALPPVVRIAGDVKAPQSPPLINTVDAGAIQMAAKYGWGNPPWFQIPKWVFSGLTGTIDNIPLNCANVGFDLRGLCAGDVNGSYLPWNGYKVAEPGLALENRGVVALREEMTFPVELSQTQSMGALTLMLNYDPTQIEITGVEMPGNAGTPPWFVAENGILSIGWASVEPVIAREGQPVLMIRARLTGATASIRFMLNENPLSELADSEGNAIPNIKLTIPDAGSSPNACCLLPVALYPNPAREILNVEFAMESDGIACVDLVTLQGVKLLTSGNIQAETGMHKMTLNISDFPNGIYLTRVTRNGQVQIQKLVVNK